ncbi:hypothetical protein V493_01044 [Pseudogymnoascus sp. VKM F-4281 (FW-2241)]|nr:hypothetical protein V493_01044 [Pseudogymnoascus sp. VKM F-4281 (FW-2241)]
MSQLDMNGPAPSIYVLGPCQQINDWYAKNMPGSTTSMKDYSHVLNLSSSDFEKLQLEISSLPFDDHGMKSYEDKQHWHVWASEFCGTRFDTAILDKNRMEWLIQAMIWLRRRNNINSKRRRGRRRVPVSASSEGEAARPRVVWVAATPNTSGEPIEKNLVVRFLKTTNELEEALPWFNLMDLKDSSKSLGPAFVDSIGPTQQPDIHQGLVLMQIVKHLYKAEVSVHPWAGFCKKFVEPEESQTMKSMLLDDEQNIRSTIIVLYCDTAICVESGMDLLYARLERLQACYGARVRAFPARAEALAARTKIRDLQALDDLARTSGSWRPITCYPVRKCSLEDADQTVHKRQESSGGECVRIKHRGDNGELTCIKTDAPERRKRKRHADIMESMPLWFHQEFVSTFATCGEFRVFIVTKQEPHSRRGLGGMIVAIAHTLNSTRDSDTMHVEQATDATFTKIGSRLRLEGLKQFAMKTFNGLRARDDWKEAFESLEVGVRLDVAISPNLPESFFVNEITRWYEAAFFSDDIAAEPKYTLCEEFARAFTAYLSKLSVP